ncbi:MAG: hypothetical protein AAGF87_10850 [Bacteroidota bacterium]
MFEVGGIYGFSDSKIPDNVAVTVCISKKPLRLIRLNDVSITKVSECVVRLKQDSPMLIGGPDMKDKFFYIHRFSTVSNALKIGKDVYFGGNVAEIFVLDEHDKLASSLIRFYSGCYDLDSNDVDSTMFKKIGHINQSDVFVPFEKIKDYWGKVYADFITDSSKIINASSIPEDNLAILDSNWNFFKSKLWLKPWLVLSILMNAISLINVGIDIKLVAPKWLSFFKFFIDFADTLSKYLTYPFQLILSIWKIDIPSVVSSTTLLTAVIVGSLRQANNESDKFFKKNSHSISASKFRNKRLTYFAEVLANYSVGLAVGVGYSGTMWLFMRVNSQIIPVVFIVLLNFLLTALLFRKGVSLEDKYRMLVFKFYILAVVFIVILMAFLNYFGLQIFQD